MVSLYESCYHDLILCSAAAIANEQEKERTNKSKLYTSPIQPSSAFHLRNRLLSRIGTKVTVGTMFTFQLVFLTSDTRPYTGQSFFSVLSTGHPEVMNSF